MSVVFSYYYVLSQPCHYCFHVIGVNKVKFGKGVNSWSNFSLKSTDKGGAYSASFTPWYQISSRGFCGNFKRATGDIPREMDVNTKWWVPVKLDREVAGLAGIWREGRGGIKVRKQLRGFFLAYLYVLVCFYLPGVANGCLKIKPEGYCPWPMLGSSLKSNIFQASRI